MAKSSQLRTSVGMGAAGGLPMSFAVTGADRQFCHVGGLCFSQYCGVYWKPTDSDAADLGRCINFDLILQVPNIIDPLVR